MIFNHNLSHTVEHSHSRAIVSFPADSSEATEIPSLHIYPLLKPSLSTSLFHSILRLQNR